MTPEKIAQRMMADPRLKALFPTADAEDTALLGNLIDALEKDRDIAFERVPANTTIFQAELHFHVFLKEMTRPGLNMDPWSELEGWFFVLNQMLINLSDAPKRALFLTVEKAKKAKLPPLNPLLLCLHAYNAATKLDVAFKVDFVVQHRKSPLYLSEYLTPYVKVIKKSAREKYPFIVPSQFSRWELRTFYLLGTFNRYEDVTIEDENIAKVKNPHAYSDLFFAASEGLLEDVQNELLNSPDVNQLCVNDTAIDIATKFSHRPVIDALLKCPQVTLQDNRKERKHSTLYHALDAYQRDPVPEKRDIIELLLKHNANFVHKDVYVYIEDKQKNLVMDQLKHVVMDNKKNTLLHVATLYQLDALFEKIVNQGVDVAIKNTDGVSPLDIGIRMPPKPQPPSAPRKL